MTERPPVHRTTSEASGYVENVYKDKAQQMQKVISYVSEKGFIPNELVANEVQWFYG
jgi:glutamate dehydrogenase